MNEELTTDEPDWFTTQARDMAAYACDGADPDNDPELVAKFLRILRAARGRGLEEAAKVCEYPSHHVDPIFDSWNEPPEDVRKTIRALKASGGEGGG